VVIEFKPSAVCLKERRFTIPPNRHLVSSQLEKPCQTLEWSLETQLEKGSCVLAVTSAKYKRTLSPVSIQLAARRKRLKTAGKIHLLVFHTCNELSLMKREIIKRIVLIYLNFLSGDFFLEIWCCQLMIYMYSCTSHSRSALSI